MESPEGLELLKAIILAALLKPVRNRLKRTNQRVEHLMKKRARLASRGARSRVVNRLTGRLEKAWALQAKLKQAITAIKESA